MTDISAPIKEETNKWSKSYLKPSIKSFDFGSGDSTTVLSLYKYIPSEDETKPFPYKLRSQTLIQLT